MTDLDAWHAGHVAFSSLMQAMGTTFGMTGIDGSSLSFAGPLTELRS